jgi:hypothetical protein
MKSPDSHNDHVLMTWLLNGVNGVNVDTAAVFKSCKVLGSLQFKCAKYDVKDGLDRYLDA